MPREKLEAYLLLAWEAHEAGEPVRAAALVERLLEACPDHPAGLSLRGALRLSTGNLDGAFEDLTQALEGQPTAAGFYNRSLIHQRRRNWRGAVTDLTCALELDPNLLEAWNNRAVVRAAQGDLSGAVGDLDRAITLRPEDAEILFNRGVLRRRLGDSEGAREDLTASLARAPEDWPGREAAQEELRLNYLSSRRKSS